MESVWNEDNPQPDMKMWTVGTGWTLCGREESRDPLQTDAGVIGVPDFQSQIIFARSLGCA